ncbi:tyrosine-type recombinase/integrase [Gordonia sp. Z-3]|uniref:tyrosine-type recombinase/integrase n=1 Tax=unclassified Gordonia (in: high G+C Gram-positive bacteria) TaxID=2657482 RepID=UPI00257A71F1|nr:MULTISPECIES: tyrosine-type recombinase/integrase [unclassified Gordonia (in: high G+C Gram-positive bacteria)]MED5803995.1 tyrosine-type recombinase/integrase [Gordonia sp. Z-3]
MNISASGGSIAGFRRRGVVPIDESAFVFEEMLEGFARQQASHALTRTTINLRRSQLIRFRRFTDSYPWQWLPGDLEDFTSSLLSGNAARSHSTLRGYHVTIRRFCEYLTDQRYEWVSECRHRFGEVPTQICFEWNTIAHLAAFEGRPGRRPFDYDEVEKFFDVVDARVDQIRADGRKGALAALRDAQLFKTTYAYGLRRAEVLGLDVADLRTNGKAPQFGRFGLAQVRFGKASRGTPPKRRTVLTLPEFDWVVEGLDHYLHQVRQKFHPGQSPALWPTERGTRVGAKYFDRRFAELRDAAGLDRHLTPHSLRHSYVTHLAEFGYSEQFIQIQVGHVFASTTALYTSVSDDYRSRVVSDAIDRFYFSPKDTR